MNRLVRIAIIVGVIICTMGILLHMQKAWRRHAAKVRPARVQPAVAKKPEARPRAPLPAITKKYPHPRIAIVIDDFGHSTRNLEKLFAARVPVTFSIMPHLKYSKVVAERARANGFEVILHLPLEAHHAKGVVEEPDTIRTGMTRDEVVARLDRAIASVPGVTGASNHQGSLATEDAALMTILLTELKKRNLFFFDSLTGKSVCKDIAARIGVPYARRNVFLDNVADTDAIRRQVLGLRKLAFTNGYATAICHDRNLTIKVIAELLPQLADDGIEFVPISAMERT